MDDIRSFAIEQKAREDQQGNAERTPPPGSTMMWMHATDPQLLEKAANLLTREARYYYEGHVEEGPNGTRVWPKESNHAQVTHHELTRTAELLRDMAKRMFKKSNKS